MTKPTIPDRCRSCIRFEENIYSGRVVCHRYFPPTTDFREDCKIRLYRKGPWIDAFVPRSIYKSRIETLFGKEILDMSNASFEEKKARAQQFMTQLKKATEGKGSSIVADFADKLPMNYQSFPRLEIGIPSLDCFFGGGIPLGGVLTLAGEPSAGKTSTLLRIIGAAQAAGKLCAFVDAEGTFDSEWARTQGVDTENLVVLASGVPPEQDFTATTLEDYLNGVVNASNAGIFDLFGLDSLDAMIARGRVQSKKGKVRDLDSADIALKARVLSDFYPRITGSLRGYGATLIQIGQLRATGIGTAFVSNKVSGGNARKYYDLLTLHLRRGPKSEWPTENNQEIGYKYVMRVDKSKVGGIREKSDMETMFFYGTGFDPIYEMTVMALDAGIIKRKGNAAAEYTDSKGNVHNIRAGKEFKIAQYVRENDLFGDLKLKVTGEVSEEEPSIPKEDLDETS